MAVPAIWDADYRYLRTALVTDVATIITDFRNEAVTNGTWTEPVGGTFQTPVPAENANRISRIVMSKSSATNLQVSIYDNYGRLAIAGAIYIDAAGSPVNYYTGSSHAIIDVEKAGGGNDSMRMFLLDPYPLSKDSHLVFMICDCSRAAAGGQSSPNLHETFTAYDVGGFARIGRIQHRPYISGSVICPFITMTGAYLFFPAHAFIKAFVSTADYGQWAGRCPQVVIGPNVLAAQAEVDVPIDAGVTGRFRVLSMPSVRQTVMLARKA